MCTVHDMLGIHFATRSYLSNLMVVQTHTINSSEASEHELSLMKRGIEENSLVDYAQPSPSLNAKCSKDAKTRPSTLLRYA
jgi:hypothetical protein